MARAVLLSNFALRTGFAKAETPDLSNICPMHQSGSGMDKRGVECRYPSYFNSLVEERRGLAERIHALSRRKHGFDSRWRAKHINGLIKEVWDRRDRWPSCEGRRRALSSGGSPCRPACALRPGKLRAWIHLRPSASSPSRQCLCATRWKDAVIGSCCCSPFRALSGLSTASFRGLGHLVWSRQSGQWSP